MPYGSRRRTTPMQLHAVNIGRFYTVLHGFIVARIQVKSIMRCLAHAAGRLLPGHIVPCSRGLLHSLSRPAAVPTPRQTSSDRQPSSWSLGRRDAASLRASVTGDPGVQGAPLKEEDAQSHSADDGDEVAGPGPGSQSLGFGASQRPLDPGLYVIPTPIGAALYYRIAHVHIAAAGAKPIHHPSRS